MIDNYQRYIKYKTKYINYKLYYIGKNTTDIYDIIQEDGDIPKSNYKFIFPFKGGVNYEKLKLTREGEYSITKRNDGQQLLDIMNNNIGLKNKTITDLTANVGGDTILFGLNAKNVKSIELNKENYRVLKHNVKIYELDNVKLYNGDSTELYNWYTDIVYIDPPWGGTDYMSKDNIDLYLGKYRLDLYIDYIITQEWKPKYIVMKLPKNYNFSVFNKYHSKKYDIVHKKKGLRFNIIIIKI
jgi:16S rRNA C967 or C1407 C5-methylase (RsmB/RsmF family)